MPQEAFPNETAIGLFPEYRDEGRAALHGTQPAASNGTQVAEALRAEVAEFVRFEMAKEVCHGIKFRGIRRPVVLDLKGATEGIEIGAHAAADEPGSHRYSRLCYLPALPNVVNYSHRKQLLTTLACRYQFIQLTGDIAYRRTLTHFAAK
ncbi:MAG: hypothetical protein ACRESX_00910 [Gammaproteobacteria bacterium]